MAALAQGGTVIVGKGATFMSTILLARLLYPEDFGLQTVAIMVMGLAGMLSSFGFQTYIIQAKELSIESLEVCFTLNIFLSVVSGLVVVCVGLASSSSSSMLREMLVLYGATIFVSGLSYCQIASMMRELQFHDSSRAELSFSLISSIFRVGFALLGFGALCFPMGDLMGATARWLVSRKAGGKVLHLRMPRMPESGHVLRFGAYTTLVGIASFVASQVDKALLTASHSAANIGLYGLATTMAGMFYGAFIVPQGSVFLAAFARLQEDIDAARKLLYSSSRFIFSIALPFNIMWVLEAERILTVLVGQKWLDAAMLVRILALDYIVRSMFGGLVSLQLSFGLAKQAARTKWLNSSLFVGFMLIAWALRLDIYGYAVMYVAAGILATAHNVHVNGRVVRLRLAPYLANLGSPLAAALASTGVWWAVGRVALTDSAFASLAITGGSWLLTYIALTALINPVVIDQLRATAGRKIKSL